MAKREDDPKWKKAFAEEMIEVAQRRPKGAPVEHDLVGLAISGGGIRSATFALGVLEALKELRALRDRLSLDRVRRRLHRLVAQRQLQAPCQLARPDATSGRTRYRICAGIRSTCRRRWVSSAPTPGRWSRSGCATRCSSR